MPKSRDLTPLDSTNPRDGALVRILEAHRGRAGDVVFSPDGQFLVSGSDDGQLIFWDLTQVLDLNRVLAHGCQHIKDYLQTNVVLKEQDRHDDIHQ